MAEPVAGCRARYVCRASYSRRARYSDRARYSRRVHYSGRARYGCRSRYGRRARYSARCARAYVCVLLDALDHFREVLKETKMTATINSNEYRRLTPIQALQTPRR